MPTPTAVSWSGGKDSLQAVREDPELKHVGLITHFTEDERIKLHGIHADLVRAQAEALGLPLVSTVIPAAADNEVYRERFTGLLARAQEELGATAVAFGDIHLSEVREFKQELTEAAGLSTRFPLWQRDTSELAGGFIEDGWKAVVTCIELETLPRELLGAEFDADFLTELPDGVDPCGERGEFHTLVYGGPGFHQTLEYRLADIPSESPEGFLVLPSDPT